MFSNMKSFELDGKLSIQFYPTSHAPAPPQPPDAPPHPPAPDAPGGPPPPGQADAPAAPEPLVQQETLDAVQDLLARRGQADAARAQAELQEVNQRFHEEIRQVEERIDLLEHRSTRDMSGQP